MDDDYVTGTVTVMWTGYTQTRGVSGRKALWVNETMIYYLCNYISYQQEKGFQIR